MSVHGHTPPAVRRNYYLDRPLTKSHWTVGTVGWASTVSRTVRRWIKAMLRSVCLSQSLMSFSVATRRQKIAKRRAEPRTALAERPLRPLRDLLRWKVTTLVRTSAVVAICRPSITGVHWGHGEVMPCGDLSRDLKLVCVRIKQTAASRSSTSCDA